MIKREPKFSQSEIKQKQEKALEKGKAETEQEAVEKIIQEKNKENLV